LSILLAPFASYHTRHLSDYAVNEVLDRYSDADLNDEEDFEAMSAAQRRAAEAQMERRDRIQRRGGRAARRTRYPGFMESDGMEDEDGTGGGLLSQMKRRTRRQYDERKDIDDLDGIEDVRTQGSVNPTVIILRVNINRKFHSNN
jgi:DNA replication licensing factor MCM2